MLCFTSFTIVLALWWWATKQHIRSCDLPSLFSLNSIYPKPHFFALVQFAFCFAFFSISQYWAKAPETQISKRYRWVFAFFKSGQIWTCFCFILGVLIYFKSLIQYRFPRFIRQLNYLAIGKTPQLWKALAYSLTMAPTAGILSVLFAFFLLLLSRQLQWLYHPKLAHLILTGRHDDFSHSDDLS